MGALTADQIYERMVKGLPAAEKVRLVEKIERDLKSAPAHAAADGDFWRSPSLAELAKAQQVTEPCSFEDLLGGWPEEEKGDNFEEAVARWRKEDVRKGDF